MKLKASKVLIASVAICVPLALCAVGCAPQAAPQEGAEGEGGSGTDAPAAATSWSPDIDCATCHASEAKTSADAACLAGTHTMDQGFECVTCHVDDSALTKAHENMSSGKVPKKLKTTEVSQDLCLSCHDQAELASTTASSAVLTDLNGKVVNPHDVPVNADHTEEGLACTSCHKGHSTDGVEKDSQAFCVSCHHADVYECGTCHE